MEVLNEKTTKQSRQQHSPKESEAFDWTGLLIQAGMWALQGAAIAIGGLMITKTYESISSDADDFARDTADSKRLKVI